MRALDEAVDRRLGRSRWGGRDAVGITARPRLVLIGGGPACAAVVIRLAEQAAAGTPPVGEILLVDPAGETGGGDPHATGVNAALLLNDDLATLDATGIGFGCWLSAHRPDWWERLASDTDPRVAGWVGRHRAAVAAGELAGLFLPRMLFGEFIRERFGHARRALAGHGVRLRVVRDAVTSLRRGLTGDWRVGLAGAVLPVRADAVVLGVGSLEPPTPPAVAGHPGLFTYRQARDLAVADARLLGLLAARPTGARRVAVLGSSAAACEVLYCLAGSPEIDAMLDDVVVVSRSGQLPDGLPSGNPEPFTCRHLPALAASWRSGSGAAPVAGRAGIAPSAAAMVAALVRDAELGRCHGYTIVDMLPALGAAFGAAFPLLPPAEKRRFTEEHFWTYRNTVRHTSTDYAGAIAALAQRGKLAVRGGAVTALSPETAGDIAVRLSQGGAGEVLRAAAVFDCRGFVGVHQTGHPLIRDLLATGAAAANRTGRGLRVNDRFEAAPGLFVLGPALAGTSQGADHIWSLENIPRIHALAPRVAAAVGERLRSAAGWSVPGHRSVRGAP